MSTSNEALTKAEFQQAMQQINRRFDDVDKRFDDIDKRFDDVDKRFGDVDKRFGDVDKQMKWQKDAISEIAIGITAIKDYLEIEDRESTQRILREVSAASK